MQIEVIFRGPECEKAKTIAVPLDNPLQDLKGTLQDEAPHEEWIRARFETLHKDLLQACEIAQEVNPPLGVVQRKGRHKSKCTSRRLKKEFPDLPDEPQISFPGVDGLSDDEMTIWECNVGHEGTVCIDNWEAPAPGVHDNSLFLGLWADAERIPATPREASQARTFEEYAASHPDFY